MSLHRKIILLILLKTVGSSGLSQWPWSWQKFISPITFVILTCPPLPPLRDLCCNLKCHAITLMTQVNFSGFGPSLRAGEWVRGKLKVWEHILLSHNDLFCRVKFVQWSNKRKSYFQNFTKFCISIYWKLCSKWQHCLLFHITNVEDKLLFYYFEDAALHLDGCCRQLWPKYGGNQIRIWPTTDISSKKQDTRHQIDWHKLNHCRYLSATDGDVWFAKLKINFQLAATSQNKQKHWSDKTALWQDGRHKQSHLRWPCTRGSASPAAAVRCHSSCRTPHIWRWLAGCLPATDGAWTPAKEICENYLLWSHRIFKQQRRKSIKGKCIIIFLQLHTG